MSRLSSTLSFALADPFLAALHFSDTSGANKSSHGTTQDQYDDAVKKVFTAGTVPSLVGQLKAYKKMVRPKRFKASDPDSMGLTRAGQNLHFFREGVSPTWEDPWNAKVSRPRCSFSLSPAADPAPSLHSPGWTSHHLSSFGTIRERLRAPSPPPCRLGP